MKRNEAKARLEELLDQPVSNALEFEERETKIQELLNDLRVEPVIYRV